MFDDVRFILHVLIVVCMLFFSVVFLINIMRNNIGVTETKNGSSTTPLTIMNTIGTNINGTNLQLNHINKKTTTTPIKMMKPIQMIWNPSWLCFGIKDQTKLDDLIEVAQAHPPSWMKHPRVNEFKHVRCFSRSCDRDSMIAPTPGRCIECSQSLLTQSVLARTIWCHRTNDEHPPSAYFNLRTIVNGKSQIWCPPIPYSCDLCPTWKSPLH
jgi:hypothetical protein